jgi:TRAP-type mannitol/chloroaromatic compound transport system permease small subunit
MKAVKAFIRIVDRINEWAGLAAAPLVPAMAAILLFEVAARYIFNKPTIWAYDIALFMFGYCGLLSGGYVLKHSGHINVDILYHELSRRRKATTDVITGFLFFFFIILVIIYGWKWAISTLALHERLPSEFGPPLGHMKLMIPVGAFLLLLQGIVKWIRDLHYAITGKELDPWT